MPMLILFASSTSAVVFNTNAGVQSSTTADERTTSVRIFSQIKPVTWKIRAVAAVLISVVRNRPRERDHRILLLCTVQR